MYVDYFDLKLRQRKGSFIQGSIYVRMGDYPGTVSFTPSNPEETLDLVFELFYTND